MTLLDVLTKLEAEARHPDAPKELAALILMVIERLRPDAIETVRQLDDAREQAEEWKKIAGELADGRPIPCPPYKQDLEKLVRELVAQGPESWHDDCCNFCGNSIVSESVEHDPNCLWRRAKEMTQ